MSIGPLDDYGGDRPQASAEAGFRRLAIGDPGLVAALDGSMSAAFDVSRLDARTECLLRISALVALDAGESSYRQLVDEARGAGIRLDDLLTVLISIAGTVGSARIISAAPRIALAAGYDVDADLERTSPVARY